MRVFSSAHDFDYNFQEVSVANWRKYCPWNKESSHVIAVDTLSRRLLPETGELRTERLITCRQPAPKWLTPFLGGTEISHVYEVSYVTPPSTSLLSSETSTRPPTREAKDEQPRYPSHQKAISPTVPLPSNNVPHIHMRSENLTWSDLIRVHEIVTYTPSPEDPSKKTKFEQRAEITALVGGWERIRERVERFTVERFGQNADRGRKGFEEVLQKSRSTAVDR